MTRPIEVLKTERPEWFSGLRYQIEPDWQGQRDCSLRWELIRGSYGVAGKTILDIGCAEGWFCRRAIEAGATSATGVDVEPYHIETARAMGEARIDYRIGDYRLLDLPVCDCVLFLSVLHYIVFPARVAALNSVARLTREVMFFEAEEKHRHTGKQSLHSMKNMLHDVGYPSVVELGETDRGRMLLKCSRQL